MKMSQIKTNKQDPICKVTEDGTNWYLNGKLHREDGPAVECMNGTNIWYLNGKLHREDGPAVERMNGINYWYLNGKCHRENGPAIDYADGTKSWYLNGKIYQSKPEYYLALIKWWEKNHESE